MADEWEILRERIKEKTSDFRDEVMGNVAAIESTLLEEVEKAKGDAVISEIKKLVHEVEKLGLRLAKLEPDTEVD